MSKMFARDFQEGHVLNSEDELLTFLKRRPAFDAKYFRLSFNHALGYLNILRV